MHLNKRSPNPNHATQHTKSISTCDDKQNACKQFVSWLPLEGFGWDAFFVFAGMACFVNTCWDSFYVLAGMGWVWSFCVGVNFMSSLSPDGIGQHMLICISCPRWHGRCLVKTSWDAFCVLAGIWWVWSIHVEMHCESSLSWGGGGQHMLRCILCARWIVMGFVNTCWHTIRVLAGIGLLRSSRVVMHFVYSLSWDGFGQHK